ncbi:MAG: phosphate/phosphite/phosphonate ABC transporter substrate-binding protein [Methylococcales bacterium]|nr:phosphate/phosphite/phosphonate ABC transporter substrate-binding protein [Methylococcales bacterium]
MLNIIKKNHFSFWLFLIVTLVISACDKTEESTYQPVFTSENTPQLTEYIVGIHPLHNPQRLMELYNPIVNYMNNHIPEVHFTLEASRDYDDFESKLYAGHFDFAMPNPYQTIQSLKHGYHIFGKMGDDDVFRGIILVRKDSKIHNVSDLKGKTISYPAPTALAATMMPQYYLHTHGLNVDRDVENIYVGSQESSIMNVFRGRVAAAATWPVPWKGFEVEHPEMAEQLVVKWQTEPLLNNGWVVRQDIPAPIAKKFAQLLFGLQDNEEGKMMLAKLPISNFESANDETYRPVREFLEKFSKTVRKIDY